MCFREAQLLDRECRSILNYLDEKEENTPWPTSAFSSYINGFGYCGVMPKYGIST
jgi:hypothetical protein